MSVSWYLKKSDGAVYGPVPLAELKLWAMDGRVAPDDYLSQDQTNWLPAPELSELEMNCLIQFASGDEYGPIHRNALTELILDEDIRPEESVYDYRHNMSSPACFVVLRSLLQQAEAPALVDTAPLNEEIERHKAARQEAEEQLAQARQQVAEEAERRQREQDEGQTEKQALEAELQRLKAERESVEQDQTEAIEQVRAEHADEMAELKQALEAARAEQTEGQQRADQIADLEQTLESERAEWGRARAQLNQAKQEADARARSLEAQTADLQRQLDEASKAQADVEARLAGMEQVPAIDDAVAEQTAALQAQLEREREGAHQREDQLKKRLAAFEGELKTRMEEMLRAKEEATLARQAGSGEEARNAPSNTVIRAALSRMQERAVEDRSHAHAPRKQAERAAILRSSRPAPKRPRKRRKPTRAPSGGR